MGGAAYCNYRQHNLGAQEVSAWQPISSAPKDGCYVYLVRYNPEWTQSLLFVSSGQWTSFAKDGGVWWLEDRNEVDEPTHWMPIEPPEAP